MKPLYTLTILLILLSAINSDAFEVKSINNSDLKWKPHTPIQILLHPAGSADLPIGSVSSAAQGAISSWNVAGSSLGIQFGGVSSVAAFNNTDGVNSILWTEQNWPYGSNVLAMTRYTYLIQALPVFYDADILVNGQNYKWGVNLTANGTKTDVRQVLTHEIGHLLGFNHTAVSNAQLYPYLPGTVSYPLSADDKAGINFLYGSSPVTPMKLISPVANAVFPNGISKNGLPLPVFRWGPSPFGTYVLEFSRDITFSKKISVRVGVGSIYALKATDEQKIMMLNPATLKVFWRVINGSSKSLPRSFAFKRS